MLFGLGAKAPLGTRRLAVNDRSVRHPRVEEVGVIRVGILGDETVVVRNPAPDERIVGRRYRAGSLRSAGIVLGRIRNPVDLDILPASQRNEARTAL